MENPGRGKPYSVRTLAAASNCERGLVEKLLTGKQKTADVDAAHSLTESLGVALLVLFAPPSSPELDEPSPVSPPTEKE